MDTSVNITQLHKSLAYLFPGSSIGDEFIDRISEGLLRSLGYTCPYIQAPWSIIHWPSIKQTCNLIGYAGAV